MRKLFFTNATLLILLNVLIKPLWIFGVDRGVQNLLGPSEYGFYFTLFNLSIIFNFAIDLGIANYNKCKVSEDKSKVKSVFDSVFSLKIMGAGIYLVLTLVAAFLFDYSSDHLKILWYLCLNQVIISIITLIRSSLSGMLMFRLDSLLSILDKLLLIIFCGVLLWTDLFNIKLTIENFVYAQTIAYSLSLLIAFGFAVKYMSVSNISFKQLNFALIKEVLPFSVLILLMTVYMRVDALMLSQMLVDGDYFVGVYAQSFRLFEAFATYGVLLSGLLLPIYVRVKAKTVKLSSWIQTSIVVIVIPTAILVSALLFYSNDFMQLIYVDNSSQSADIFFYHLLGLISISVSYVFGTLLTAKRRLKQLNIFALISVCLNIVLNYVLIPTYQGYGAALSSLVTLTAMVLMQIIASQSLLQQNLSKIFLYKLILFSAALFTTAKIVSVYVSLIGGFAIICFSGLLFAFIFRLINVSIISTFITTALNKNTQSL